MKTTCYLYVLTSQWNSVVASESLEKKDLVQIWAFCVGRELGFTHVRVYKKLMEMTTLPRMHETAKRSLSTYGVL